MKILRTLLPLILLVAGCGGGTTPPQPGPKWDLQIVVRAKDAANKPIAGAKVDIVDGPNLLRDGTTSTEGIWSRTALEQAGQTICVSHAGFFDNCQGVTLTSSMSIDVDLVPDVVPDPPQSIAGRIRAQSQILVNDAGPWVWRGRSDFDLLDLALAGNWQEVEARIENAKGAKITNLRVFAMASNLFKLTPDDPGYEGALNVLLGKLGTAGIYLNFCVFPDAQILYPNSADRHRVLNWLMDRWGQHHGIIWELANEPWQNGWSSATDQKLLELAGVAKSRLGHKDFIIGDPRDGDDPDASAETIAESRKLAGIVNLLALHSSRKGGANPDGDRMRRWVDHLEGAYDIVLEARKVNTLAYLVQIEPMGQASQQFVPLPGGRTYEREFDPEVALAGAATALYANLGYTYHRIAAQDAGTPGQDLIATALGDLPVGGGWKYYNDSWDGSATRGFSCKGKVRSWLNGSKGFVLAYGLNSHCTITWANGYAPKGTRFRSVDSENGRLQESKVTIYDVSK